MPEIEELKISLVLEGELKGYFVAYIAGVKEPAMKSKTKSKLLRSLYRYFLSQNK